MKCPRCEKEVNEENQYCPYCGQKLVKKEDHISKEIKELRWKQLSLIMNRILNIATIVAAVFVIIAMFGPTLTFTDFEVGGLSWFSYEGWIKMQNGEITVGPFITTFALYLIVFGGIIAISSRAIYKAINSIRKHDECHTISHIIALSLIYHIYASFIANFYYEYVHTSEGTFEVGSGWGQTIFNISIPFFTIALIIFLIARAVFNEKPKMIVSHIFAIVSVFMIVDFIDSAFNVLGFQNLSVGEQDVFGTLHYFDLMSDITFGAATTIILMFILGLSLIASVCLTIIFTLKDLVSKNTINRKLFLTLNIVTASIAFVMLIVDMTFGAVINGVNGFNGSILHLSGSLLALFLGSQFTLGLAIAIYIMGKNTPIDDSIIDQEVIEKDA